MTGFAIGFCIFMVGVIGLYGYLFKVSKDMKRNPYDL